jgi:hypothetical protein
MTEKKGIMKTSITLKEISMRRIVIVTALVASVLASAVSAQANTYLDPRVPFDAEKFFNVVPAGQ